MGRPPLEPGGRGAQADGGAGLCIQDQLLLRRVTRKNEGLFREKRRILEQLHSLEEAKQSDGQALCALQNRWGMIPLPLPRLCRQGWFWGGPNGPLPRMGSLCCAGQKGRFSPRRSLPAGWVRGRERKRKEGRK